MILAIKKAFKTIAINPHIMLLSVVYLLIISALLPVALVQKSGLYFLLIGILLLLFTGAFSAGWFGLIHCALKYEKSEEDEEEFRKKYAIFKEGFFASVPKYMLALISFSILFAAFAIGMNYLSDFLFGKPDEIIKQLISVSNDYNALVNFLVTMPEESINLVVKRGIFVHTTTIIYALLTIYAVPALYFCSTSNPFKGLIKGVVAFFKKPFATIGAFLVILFAHFLITLFELIAIKTQVLLFIALVLRIYFSVFVVVLIFSLYEEYFANCCNNGTDSLGQDQTCN